MITLTLKLIGRKLKFLKLQDVLRGKTKPNFIFDFLLHKIKIVYDIGSRKTEINVIVLKINNLRKKSLFLVRLKYSLTVDHLLIA